MIVAGGVLWQIGRRIGSGWSVSGCTTERWRTDAGDVLAFAGRKARDDASAAPFASDPGG